MIKNFNKLTNSNAITLTELLVSSILVGIIMVGIVSINFAMKRLEDTSSAASILASEADALMSMLKTDASLAVGRINDSGVRTFETGTDRCICFRHETLNTPQTPGDYTDDVWTCYAKVTNTIQRKTFAATESGGGLPGNFASCTSTGAGIRIMTDLLDISSLDFYNVPGGCPVNACAAPAENQMTHIEFSFTAIRNPSAAVDALSNPTVDMTTNVNPMMHGRR